MNRLPLFAAEVIAVLLTATTLSLSAQDEETNPWSAGADLVSSYVWRGTRLGSGPHIQPAIEFSGGSFTAGAWGSFDFHGYEEVDIYMTFDIPGGFTIGLQDYYLPELSLYDFSATGGSHAFEAGLAYASERVWLGANYIINEAGGIGSYGGDLYFEGGLSFDYFSLFLGAGNGWHTLNGRFNVCNLGLEVCREISITDRFSVPVTGQLIFNPDNERMFLVVGFSFF